MLKKISVVVAFAVSACAPMGTPVLDVTATPRTIVDASPVRIKLQAITAEGLVGKGTVTLVTERGTLSSSSAALDSFGTATVDLVCDPVAEPGCLRSFRVVGEWVVDKLTVNGEVRLNQGATMSGPDGGTTMDLEFMQGLRMVDKECMTGDTVGIDPACCRPPSTMPGKQHPGCPVFQIEWGAAVDVTFDGFDALGASIGPGTHTMVLDEPRYSSTSNCSASKGLQMRDGSALVSPAAGKLVAGWVVGADWNAFFDGKSSLSKTMMGPVQSVCTKSQASQVGYFVVTAGLEFTKADGTFWRQSDGRRFVYTVRQQ